MPDLDGPTLIVITAGNCSACNIFKRFVRTKLFEQLKSDDIINITTFEFETLATVKFLPEMHKGVVKFAGYLPTLLLTLGQLWNNQDSKLEGVVHGRQEINGVIQPMPRFPLDYDEIYKWINEQLKDNPLFFKIGGYNNSTDYGNNIDDVKYIPTIGSMQMMQTRQTNQKRQMIYRGTNLPQLGLDMMDYGQ